MLSSIAHERIYKVGIWHKVDRMSRGYRAGDKQLGNSWDIAESRFCLILLVFLSDRVLLYKVLFTFFIILCDNWSIDLLTIFLNLWLNLRVFGSFLKHLFSPLKASDRMLNTYIFKMWFRGVTTRLWGGGGHYVLHFAQRPPSF